MSGQISEKDLKRKKMKERLEKQKQNRILSLFVIKDGVPSELNDTSIAILIENKNNRSDNRILNKLWLKWEFDQIQKIQQKKVEGFAKEYFANKGIYLEIFEFEY